jgi:SAM-dependent methyltransferase
MTNALEPELKETERLNSSGSWYDYPQYYDMAFRAETRGEADFIEAACRKYVSGPVRRLLESGCGGGRLIAELASRGYEMIGFDTNEASLDYARRRLMRRKLTASVFHADMCDFKLRKRVDGAFNTWNTFRHLVTEKSARRHLQCVAQCLRRGGIYLLGLHLLPLDVSEECTERWIVRHGRTRLSITLRVVATDRRRRIERLRTVLHARTPRRTLRLATEFPFRMYTADQFRHLLRGVPELQLCDVYDFWYDIDHPLELDDRMTDTVFVLRRI